MRFEELLDRLLEPAARRRTSLAFAAVGASNAAALPRRRGDVGARAVRASCCAASRRSPAPACATCTRAGPARCRRARRAARASASRPTLEDWLALLADYALRCLRAHRGGDGGRAAPRRARRRPRRPRLHAHAHRRARRPLGHRPRPGAARPPSRSSPARRSPPSSMPARATLRAVVLCDTERPPGARRTRRWSSAAAGAGSSRAIAADARLAVTRPLLVTRETFAVRRGRRGGAGRPSSRAARRARPRGCAPGGRTLRAEVTGGDRSRSALALGAAVRRLVARVPGRHARAARGGLGRAGGQLPRRRDLGGGEHLHAPDARALAAPGSRATRTRSRRTGTSSASRPSSSAAPPTTRRFVRRHAHLHAPCEDGSIESGVSHVHPELSPFAPPPAADFAELNAAALDRARRPGAARERWRDRRALPRGRASRRCSSVPAPGEPALPAHVAVGELAPARRPRWWLLPAAAPAGASPRCCRSNGPRGPSRTRCARSASWAARRRQPGLAAARRRLRALPAAATATPRRTRASPPRSRTPSLPPADHRYVVSRPVGWGRAVAALRPRLAPGARADWAATGSAPTPTAPPSRAGSARASCASRRAPTPAGDALAAGGRGAGGATRPSTAACGCDGALDGPPAGSRGGAGLIARGTRGEPT